MNAAVDLRLALAAFERGLITGEQLARVAHDTGATPREGSVAQRLRALGLDATTIGSLHSAVHGTLGYEQRTVVGASDDGTQVEPEPHRDAPSTDDPTASFAALLTVGLDPARFAQRYAQGAEIGRGGVGRVVAADDALMGRTVALKALHAGAVPLQAQRRFVREARITAQLEHPNVVPVYDMGTLPEGAPCFTMKWVRGRSLAALLAGGQAEGGEVGLYRLLQVLTQICMAVDYAHSKGVVHRDLKPANVMVGDFGEVLVMDWGIAKRLGHPDDLALGDAVDPAGHTADLLTMDGSVVGTPGYMAPEQALGRNDRIDARTDVFALGAILYEMLTGSRPFAGGSAFVVLIATTKGELEPPSARAGDRAVPPDLEEICLRALAHAPEDRYPSARALRDDLERYLTGERERERRGAEADRLVAEGEQVQRALAALQAEQGALATQLADAPALTGHEPIDQKRQRWAAIDRDRELRAEIEQARARAESRFLGAVERQPEHASARRHLADLHWAQYREARETNDHRAALEHLEQVERFDDATYRSRLAPTVPLSIETDPPGAEVVLYRYVERDRVLVTEPLRALGATPLLGAEVPTGRHLVELRLPDRRPVRLPVMAWHGDELTFSLRVPSEAELGADYVFVPAGTYMRGGDPAAVLAHPAHLTWVDAFAIARFPVTCGAYFAFLDDLPPDEALRRVPREGGRPLFAPDAEGRWTLPARDPDGDLWEADWPVCLVSYEDACAYAAWRSAIDGATYRLPRDDEWEKAARGPDGRPLPWGDHFDVTFCCVRGSVPGNPYPQPVGRFPTDTSPYGVRDMAGGIRDWVDAWFEPGHKTVRGGAYSLYPFFARAAGRWGHSQRATVPNIGFRLVKDLAG